MQRLDWGRNDKDIKPLLAHQRFPRKRWHKGRRDKNPRRGKRVRMLFVSKNGEYPFYSQDTDKDKKILSEFFISTYFKGSKDA